MDKSNQKARRSSILKLPRQKYSDEEDETTAIESTIARNKRRVSFASSNFVKPFVSDPEQNTIWDTTYEEAVDHTNSTRSSQDLASVQSVNETESIAKNSPDDDGDGDDDDVEMMDIDEAINTTLLDTTQHVDFTNMSLEEMEITNVADKENIVPSKCRRGSIVDFAQKLDALQNSSGGLVVAVRELAGQNSRNIYVPTTGRFEIPLDQSRKSFFDALHHTTSLSEITHQGTVESVKSPFVNLSQVSNITTSRHQNNRQFGNERLSASSAQIQASSVGSLQTSRSFKVNTDQNHSASSLLSSDSVSAMDLTCEDQDIELGKFISDVSLKSNENKTDMEFTWPISTEQRKSLDKNLSSIQSSNQTKTSTVQDFSSMELTCQIPTCARKSIGKEELLPERLTRQVLTDSVKSIEQNLSSEFTCRISTEARRSFNKDRSLKESRTEKDELLDQDLSSMEFTCQIPTDDNSAQITDQTRKSIVNNSSSMELTCQIPTDAVKSISNDQSLNKSVQSVNQDLSSMEFTCQISTEHRKSLGSNMSSTEIRSQKKLIDKNSSSIELHPADARRSFNKDHSLTESQTNKKSLDQDLSSMEFTCQIPVEQRKSSGNDRGSINKDEPLQESQIDNMQSVGQDLSSMEFTCQIPIEQRKSVGNDKSINKDKSLQELRIDHIQSVNQDLSSIEFTCQIPIEQRKSIGNDRMSINKDQSLKQSRSEHIQESVDQDLSSMEFTCKIPIEKRKSVGSDRFINKDKSLQELPTDHIQSVNKDLSSMEFTCQIPVEQRKSIGSDRRSNKNKSPQESRIDKIQSAEQDILSMEFTCQISPEQRKSTGKDLSSMEFTCQIPPDARRFINNDHQSLQESRIENVHPTGLDTSSMEFTCQIPTESKKLIGSNLSTLEITHKRKSTAKNSSSMEFTCQISPEQRKPLGNNRLPIEISNQRRKSAAQDLSSMELTCQIPSGSRRSHNKDQLLQESICQKATKNIKQTDLDLSSMEFTCQIPSEQRKSFRSDLPPVQITNQTKKSTSQDLSSMELTCLVPADFKRSHSSQDPVCQVPAENTEGQDLPFMDSTGQTSIEDKKSVDENRSTVEFSDQNQTDHDMSSVEFSDQLPTDNKTPIHQNQSLMQSTTDRKSTDQNPSKSMELTGEIPSQIKNSVHKNQIMPAENREPANQDFAAAKLTCHIPVEEKKSIEENLPTAEFADMKQSENKKSIHKESSSMDDTRQIIYQSRKSLDKNRSVFEVTCQIPSENTESFNYHLPSMEFTDQVPADKKKSTEQNQSESLELTGQISSEMSRSTRKNQSLAPAGEFPSEVKKSIGKNLSFNKCELGNHTENMEMDSLKRDTFATNVSSLNLTSTGASIETSQGVKNTESAMEIDSEHIPVIDETNPIPKENAILFNRSTRLIEKPVELAEIQNEKDEKSAIGENSICNISRNVLAKSTSKLEAAIKTSQISSDDVETSMLEANKGCKGGTTFIEDLGDTMTDLTHRRQHFTSLNPLERSVISAVQLIDDETKRDSFVTASSQPKMNDCENEEIKATNILYSQKFSGPKLQTDEKPVSERKTPTTSFHMTLTPNLTMLDSQICNFTKSFPDLMTTTDNIDNLNETSFMAQPKQVMRISLPPMEHEDPHFIADFKCSLIDENDLMNSDTSEIEQDNRLMHVNDTYVLKKTKSDETRDKTNFEMDDMLGKPNKTFAKTDELVKDRSLNQTDQMLTKSDETFAKSDQTIFKTDETLSKYDRTFAQNDRTSARNDQTFAKGDQTFAKNDLTYAKNDQTFARNDQTFAKSDQTSAKRDQTIAKRGQAIAKDSTDGFKTQPTCQELRMMRAPSKNSEAFKKCYTLLDNFRASINILQDGTKLDLNIVNNDDNDRMNRLLSLLEDSPTRLTARKKLEPQLRTFSNTTANPDKSLHKILHEQRLQIKNYLENFEFKPFNLSEVETKSSEDISDGSFENVTEEISAELMSMSINENLKKSVDFTQEIRRLERTASGYWILEKVDARKCYFSTLHGCLQFNVDFDDISGVVSNLELKRNMPDPSHPYADYVFHLMYEKLSNPLLSSAIGNKYDILSLLEYVHLISTKSLKFHQEYERMQENGLVIKNMTATFTIIDIKLHIWWNITVDLKQGKLVDLDAKQGTDLLKSKVPDIFNMLKICPKGFDFLFSFINSIEDHFKI